MSNTDRTDVWKVHLPSMDVITRKWQKVPVTTSINLHQGKSQVTISQEVFLSKKQLCSFFCRVKKNSFTLCPNKKSFALAWSWESSGRSALTGPTARTSQEGLLWGKRKWKCTTSQHFLFLHNRKWKCYFSPARVVEVKFFFCSLEAELTTTEELKELGIVWNISNKFTDLHRNKFYAEMNLKSFWNVKSHTLSSSFQMRTFSEPRSESLKVLLGVEWDFVTD